MSNNINWATNNESVPFHFVSPFIKTNNVIVKRWGGLMNWAGSYFLEGTIDYGTTLMTVVNWKMIGGHQFHDGNTAVGPDYENGAVGDCISLKWHGVSTVQNTWRQLSVTFFVAPSN